MSYYIYIKYVELFYYYFNTILSVYGDLDVVAKFSSIHEKVKVHFRFRTKIFFPSKKWRKRKSDEFFFFVSPLIVIIYYHHHHHVHK